MKPSSLPAALMLLVLLAGCGAPTVGEPALPALAEDTCGANQHGALIGQDVSTLEQVLIMRQVRILRPGTAMTMDFRAERINFEIGRDERIKRIFCG